MDKEKNLKQATDGQGDNPVLEAILTRRSIRKFTSAPIPKDKLECILKAGYYAPSGCNRQTWRFTVVQNQKDIERLKEATLITAKDNKVYCYGFENPACLILISNDDRNVTGGVDAICAAENIFLAAHSFGIGSVFLNPLKTLRHEKPVEDVLDEFGIPQNHTIWCMAALGYPAEEGKLLAKRNDVVRYVGEE